MAIDRFQLEQGVPIGAIIAWVGGYFTPLGVYANVHGSNASEANTFLNPKGWAVCDGVEYNDPSSSIFNGAGRHLPTLTDDRFLMGGNGVGAVGGSNTLTDHTHGHSLTMAHTHSHSLTHAHTHADSFSIAHTHTINHDHVAASGALKIGSTSLEYTSSPTMSTTDGSTSVGFFRSGTNALSVDLPSYSGTSGGVSADISGSVGAASTSAVSGTVDSASTSTVTGTVGTGSASTSTENRPKYLSCLYIMKVR